MKEPTQRSAERTGPKYVYEVGGGGKEKTTDNLKAGDAIERRSRTMVDGELTMEAESNESRPIF